MVRRYEVIDPHQETRDSQFACVELVGQSKEENAAHKIQSAACNLFSLNKKSPEKPLTKPIDYEKLSEDGYKDETDCVIQPKEYFEAALDAAIMGDTELLDRFNETIFVSKFGPFTSKKVNQAYADSLFPKK